MMENDLCPKEEEPTRAPSKTKTVNATPGSSNEEEKVIKQHSKIICDFPDCSRTFKKPSLLRQHMTTHTGERPFGCEECGKSFIRQYHLKRHHSSVHAKEFMFMCPYEGCSYVCNINHNLNRHVKRNHEQQLPFKCSAEGCVEAFKKHKLLEAHEVTDHGREQFQCKYQGCKKTYQTSAKLRRHTALHRKQKAYFCKNENCNAMFYTWSELRKHIFTCTVYKCKECDKIFKKAYVLKKHEQTHKKERILFKCPIEGCDREYTTRSNVVMHVKTYHASANTFKCPQDNCGQTFAYKVSLERHLKNHEKIVRMYEKIAKNKKKADKKRRKQKRLHTSAVSKISGFVHELDKLVDESDVENQPNHICDNTLTTTDDENENVGSKSMEEQEDVKSTNTKNDAENNEIVAMKNTMILNDIIAEANSSDCTVNTLICC